MEGDVGDFDGGGGCAYFEGQVDALASADRDGDVVGDGFGEASGSGGDGVDTDVDGRDLIVSIAVGRCLGGDRGGVVGDGDHCAGDCRSAGVADGSDDASVFVLSVKERGYEEKQEGRQKSWC